MMIVYGTCLAGTYARQQDGVHLATKFAHIYYLPLWPLQSWVVLRVEGDGAWRGIELPRLVWRSVILAWARAALVLVGGTATVVTAVCISSGSWFSPLLVAVLAWAALYASYPLARLPPQAMGALAKEAGAPAAAVEQVLTQISKPAPTPTTI